MDMREHFDFRKGWEATCHGWHEHTITFDLEHSMYYYSKYCEVVDWIAQNVEMHIRHSRWCRSGEKTMSVKFRFAKDYTLFMLRWA